MFVFLPGSPISEEERWRSVKGIVWLLVTSLTKNTLERFLVKLFYEKTFLWSLRPLCSWKTQSYRYRFIPLTWSVPRQHFITEWLELHVFVFVLTHSLRDCWNLLQAGLCFSKLCLVNSVYHWWTQSSYKLKQTGLTWSQTTFATVSKNMFSLCDYSSLSLDRKGSDYFLRPLYIALKTYMHSNIYTNILHVCQVVFWTASLSH